MADEADMAQARMEIEMELTRKRVAAPELPAVGECHYCTASVPAGLRFCDEDCRDAYQYEQRMRQRNGR